MLFIHWNVFTRFIKRRFGDWPSFVLEKIYWYKMSHPKIWFHIYCQRECTWIKSAKYVENMYIGKCYHGIKCITDVKLGLILSGCHVGLDPISNPETLEWRKPIKWDGKQNKTVWEELQRLRWKCIKRNLSGLSLRSL